MFERTAGERPRRARRARAGTAGGLRRLMPDLMARETLGWWLVSRIGIFVLSISAPLLFNRGTDYPNVWHAWLQWDVWHFKAIAEFGYNNGEPSGAPLAAFFPGLPILMRVASWTGIGPVAGGIVVSLIASAFAGVALARLAQYEFPQLQESRADGRADVVRRSGRGVPGRAVHGGVVLRLRLPRLARRAAGPLGAGGDLRRAGVDRAGVRDLPRLRAGGRVRHLEEARLARRCRGWCCRPCRCSASWRT